MQIVARTCDILAFLILNPSTVGFCLGILIFKFFCFVILRAKDINVEIFTALLVAAT